MLDLRSQRDVNTDVDDANKSMLDGDNIADSQKEWLEVMAQLRGRSDTHTLLVAIANPRIAPYGAAAPQFARRVQCVNPQPAIVAFEAGGPNDGPDTVTPKVE